MANYGKEKLRQRGRTTTDRDHTQGVGVGGGGRKHRGLVHGSEIQVMTRSGSIEEKDIKRKRDQGMRKCSVYS